MTNITGSTNIKKGYNKYFCKTLRLMNFLIKDGHECLGLAVDNEDSSKRIFLFEYTDTLNDSLARYTKDRIEKIGK